MTTRKIYLAELTGLTEQVNRMGIQLEHMIDQLTCALADRNADLAKALVKEDDIVDQMEREIERSCIDMIAKQQPVASDLRRISSIMRLISDIERIADHCADIAEHIIDLCGRADISQPQGLSEMFRHMRGMVSKTINSFIEEDMEAAQQAAAADDAVDHYFYVIKDELSERMAHEPENIRAYVDYLLIVKYVERMADHATNIAEWVEFMITGNLEEYMNP